MRVDFAQVREHVQRAIAAIEPVDSAEAIEAAGAQVRRGTAVLTADGQALIDGEPVRFRQALLATGAAPMVPDLPGLRAAEPLTSDTVWDLEELPERLVVLGGGSIGCELAQAFARLGATVTLLEAQERVLTREHPRASDLIADALRADGVELRLGVAVEGVCDGAVQLANGSAVAYDRLLVAFGRAPRTSGIGLEQAGVECDERGYVRVDTRLRTTNPRVWAAGDLTGHPQFTHTAGVHGSLAASNAVLGLRRTVDPDAIPRVAFTSPEVAAVGRSRGAREVRVEHGDLDRAIAEGDTQGFTSLVLDRKDRIVGATVVGPRAGESLGELSLAVSRRMRVRDLAGAMHAYPTYSDAIWNAAVVRVRHTLGSGATARATGALRRIRQRWLDRTDPRDQRA